VRVDGDAVLQTEIALAGQLMSTLQYRSPEQIRDAQNVTSATDVYSLGVSLYHALAAWPPVAGDSLASLCLAHLSEPPPDLRKRAAGIPEALAALVHRCLEKRASEPPTAQELAFALSAVADELQALDVPTCVAAELHSLTLSREA